MDIFYLLRTRIYGICQRQKDCNTFSLLVCMYRNGAPSKAAAIWEEASINRSSATWCFGSWTKEMPKAKLGFP